MNNVRIKRAMEAKPLGYKDSPLQKAMAAAHALKDVARE
jgi:hypothetical protein